MREREREQVREKNIDSVSRERRADVRDRLTHGVEKGKKGKKERRFREFKRERRQTRFLPLEKSREREIK